jgi:hypothetical protein
LVDRRFDADDDGPCARTTAGSWNHHTLEVLRLRAVDQLERTASALPTRPGCPERQTFDYVGHGTTTLFVALGVATGRVTDACTQRHHHYRGDALVTRW